MEVFKADEAGGGGSGGVGVMPGNVSHKQWAALKTLRLFRFFRSYIFQP